MEVSQNGWFIMDNPIRRKFRSQTSDNMDRWKPEMGRVREKGRVEEQKLRCRKCTKHTRSGPLLAVEMSKKCTPLWREAHFEVKMYKTHQVQTTFGSGDVEKVHAVVARSTFRSQNVKNTRGSDHFWRFRCRKGARGCGTSTFPSQNVKNTRASDHFWRFRCRKSARGCGTSTFPSQNVKSTRVRRFRCRFPWQAQRIVHLVKSEQNVRVL